MFHRTIVKYTNISLLSDSFTIFDVQQGMIIRYHSISFTSISNSSSLPQMQQQQLTPTRIQFTCPFCIFSFFFSHQLTGWPLRKSHLLFSAGHHIHNLCHNVRISLSLSLSILIPIMLNKGPSQYSCLSNKTTLLWRINPTSPGGILL